MHLAQSFFCFLDCQRAVLARRLSSHPSPIHCPTTKPPFLQSSFASMDPLADRLSFGDTAPPPAPEPETRSSMSPAVGDTTQTPESKSTSGFASVFKSLTGSKSSRGPNPQSPAAVAQHPNGAHTLQPAIYGGPPNYEHLYEQLKPERPLASRLSAAESLRLAVQDYPLSGVSARGQD